MNVMMNTPRVLLTGATGYVGGRLRRRLEERGVHLRCLARRPDELSTLVAPGTEIVAGDLHDLESLRAAMRGIHVAYYLVHSMGAKGDFRSQDRRAAENFARAAREAGVRRIVYLGGLGRGEELSNHLASRQEVGRILRESGVPTLELRAGIIIGSQSLSFELIRALVNRLPVMTTPTWVSVRTQPIAIEDVLSYLLESMEIPLEASEIHEIGGPDQVSYRDMMSEYASQTGLRRWIIPVPVLSPWLSSLWLGLVTPIYARIGRKLIDSLRNETIVHDRSAERRFQTQPMGIREAVARALANEDQPLAETRWCDAFSSKGATTAYGGSRFGRLIVDSRAVRVPGGAAQAFAPIRRIGGSTGWYYGNFLWRLRGFIDLLAGGVGSRRGRRDPELVRRGDTIDFWRVESYEPDRLLRLRAEMKVPGRAWLEFEARPDGGSTWIRQTAIFEPHFFTGRLYWYGLYPIHRVMFAGMLRAIARRGQVGEIRIARPLPSPTASTTMG